jgi:hypothetical protein
MKANKRGEWAGDRIISLYEYSNKPSLQPSPSFPRLLLHHHAHSDTGTWRRNPRTKGRIPKAPAHTIANSASLHGGSPLNAAYYQKPTGVVSDRLVSNSPQRRSPACPFEARFIRRYQVGVAGNDSYWVTARCSLFYGSSPDVF